MKKVRYTDGPDEVTVVPAGKESFAATRGEWVEVDAEVADGLAEQGWEIERASRPKTDKEN